MSDSHDHGKEVSHTPDKGHDDGHHSMHYGLYLTVGGLLIAGTVATVALSYMDFGSRSNNIIVAMILATFKVGLVAAIFMHLKGEKWTIWKFLIFTMIFVAGLFFLTLLHWTSPIPGTTYNIH